MKRAVILLGAGGPRGWGAPLTTAITKKLFEDQNYKTKSGENLAKYIYKYLKKDYKEEEIDESSINFETIINTLENIQDYYIPETGGGPNFRESLSAWFSLNKNIYDEIMNYNYNEETRSIKNLATGHCITCDPLTKEMTYINSAIKNYIFIISLEISKYDNNYYDNEEKKNLSKKLKEFILFLKDEKDITPRVYTTNYDRLFQNIFHDTNLNFFDGFDMPLKDENAFIANIPKILNDDQCLTYYNLHGCIYWHYDFLMNKTKYEYISKPKEGFCLNPNSIRSQVKIGNNPIVYNIVTGYNKLDRTSIQPLKSFQAAFLKDCINTDIIIIIGYSYSDPHIDGLIQNAIENKNPNILKINLNDNSNKNLDSNKKEKYFYQGFQKFLEDSEWKKIESFF